MLVRENRNRSGIGMAKREPIRAEKSKEANAGVKCIRPNMTGRQKNLERQTKCRNSRGGYNMFRATGSMGMRQGGSRWSKREGPKLSTRLGKRNYGKSIGCLTSKRRSARVIVGMWERDQGS